ncbi:MAG: PPC domain-containing protein, partial [Pirellulaceae bacterium]|nr:PPC domain-containing protein [Pirellulaceae bacterium]
MLFLYRGWVTVGLILLMVSWGRSAEPSIESFSPRVLQRGVTSEVKFVGAGLAACQELKFYSPGIQCSKLQIVDDYSIVATLEVSPDCKIAAQAFRLRSDEGFSELRTMHVSRFPVVIELARKSVDAVVSVPWQIAGATPARALTIAGTLQDGDYDRYAISMNKGQRLTAEVEAIRLGGELLDTVLSVTDPNGRIIAINDDGALLHQDPHLSVTAEVDGVYIVEVHETNYGGSASSQYALHVGSFPASGVAYPAGGQAGKITTVSLLNASQHSDEVGRVQQIELLEDSAAFQLFATDELGTSATPIPFRMSTYANVLESEPNNQLLNASGSGDTVSAFSVPIALNGILQTSEDVDYFPFQATAGESLRLEVFASRIGSPVDSLLYLFNAAGRLLTQNDDNGSHDSCIEWTAPATGVYWVGIHDKLHRGWADGVYRIELEKTKPELTAFLPRPDRVSQRKQTISIPQGNRVVAKIGLLREGMDDSPAQLTFADLPAGVHASPVYVAPNAFWALAILEAETEATLGGSLCRVAPTVEISAQSLTGEFCQVVDLIAESADRLYEATVVDRLAVAVTPAMPFSIDVVQPQVALPLGGTIDLVIRVNRLSTDASDAGRHFKAPVKIEFPFLPDGCVSEPYIIIDGDKSEGTFRITATPDAQLGDHKLAAVASVHLSDTRSRGTRSGSKEKSVPDAENWFRLKDREIASPLIDLRVATSPLVGDFEPMAVEQDAKLKVRCKLTTRGPVPEQLHCELEGLPNRIITTAIDQASSTDMVEFEVQVPRDAPLGAFSNIQCRLSGELQGSQV